MSETPAQYSAICLHFLQLVSLEIDDLRFALPNDVIRNVLLVNHTWISTHFSGKNTPTSGGGFDFWVRGQNYHRGGG